jgi:hypothetical protein
VKNVPKPIRGIAFLPWLTLDAERLLSRFRLVPYGIGRSNDVVSLIPHAHIDQALRFYRDSRRKPIQRCSLVAFADRAIGAELSETDVQEIFIFGELLAFSALAKRRFFQNGFGYVSRDQYVLVVQQLPEQFSGSIALTYRRRDGGITHGIGADDYPIPIPPHVGEQAPLTYDDRLLGGLLKAWTELSARDWQRSYEAVNAFNLANTDSEAVPEHMELVLLHGAFERAMGVKGGDTNDFVAKLSACFQINTRVHCRTKGAIQPKPKPNEPYVLEAWARDFCLARGSVAHGHGYAAAKPTWSLRNHLLLATYLLPLVMKRVLAKAGTLPMCGEDVALIDAFECLASFDHFARSSQRTTPPWRRIMSELELDLIARKVEP